MKFLAMIPPLSSAVVPHPNGVPGSGEAGSSRSPVYLIAAGLGMSGGAAALPEGEGRETVEAVCATCHDTSLIERSSGYSRDHWRFLASTMIDLAGNAATQGEILDCLAAAFPAGGHRAATRAAGSVAIRFEEWQVPTPGQRARDPVEGPDGSIWWVGQWQDILGRLDPETGVMEEFALPAGARPHSVYVGPDGAIWYNESGVRPDMLVRFNPVDETFQSWPIPSGPVHAGILRHMRTTRDDGALLIHQSGTGHIARVTVESDGS